MDFQEINELFQKIIVSENKKQIEEFKKKYPNFYKDMFSKRELVIDYKPVLEKNAE